MKGRILSIFICLSSAAYAQQESQIQIDSGNNNQVIIKQSTATDSSQKSNIRLHHSDSNAIEVSQVGKATGTVTEKKAAGFMDWITNTNTFFVALISIGTFIGLLWKGIPFLKGSKVKK
jgi:hypothetical protein